MRNRLKVKLGTTFIIIAISIAFGQVNAQSGPLFTSEYGQHSDSYAFTQKVALWSLFLPAASSEKTQPLSLASFKAMRPTGQAYRYKVEDLAFFCRLEVHLEKATKIPVRFRIGDVQQVDYLEGKFEGWRYGY